MTGRAPALAPALAVALVCGCSSLPDLRFGDGGAGASDAAGDGGQAGPRDGGSDAAISPCPTSPPPGAICCGARVCEGCAQSDCGDCASRGCSSPDVCCRLPNDNIQCKQPNSCN